jgi:hypothetical protein
MNIFGPGVLIASIPGGTPVNIGFAQEITFNDKVTLKSAYGQNRYALAVGAGTAKTSVKAKFLRVSSLAISQLLIGVAPTPGGNFMQFGELHTLATVTPSLTIAPPNSGTFYSDQGLVYSATGLPLQYTTSAPTTGKYSLNPSTGVYSFAAGDAGVGVIASYLYSTGSIGQSLNSGNPIIGPSISTQVNILYTDPNTQFQATLQLFNVVWDGIDFATKLEDFVYPEMNGECFVNAAQQLYQWNSQDKF